MGKPFLDPGSLPLRKSCVCLSSVCRCLAGKVRPSKGHVGEGVWTVTSEPVCPSEWGSSHWPVAGCHTGSKTFLCFQEKK